MFHPASPCRSFHQQLSSQSPHDVRVFPSSSQSLQILRCQPGNTRPVHPPQTSPRPATKAMKSITRQAECVATGENRSCLCSAHLFSGATNGQVDRIVGFHVLHHSVRKKRHRSRPACPVRRLHKLLTVHVSVAASSSIFPFSSTRQIPVSSSIDAFATKSSALQHFSVSESSPEFSVSMSALFLVAASGVSISTSVIPSRIGVVPLNFFVASKNPRIRRFRAERAIDVPGSSVYNRHFRRPSQWSVLAESRMPRAC